VICAAPLGRIDARLAQHIGAERTLEQAMDRGLPEIETAGIGTKRRQNHARAVCDEAAPAQASAAHRHRRTGMEMARNLAGLEEHARLMPEHEAAKAVFFNNLPAKPGRRRGVVIACDPDPVRALRKVGEHRAFARIQTLGRVAIVEGIA